jgi:O-antigen/teichoic acid export membrane protein
VISADKSQEPESLVGRSARALKWGYLGVAARVILQLAAQIALARMLGPAAFGVVAAAVLIVLIAGIVVELGQGPALIQAATIEAADVRNAFTRVLIATGCAVAAILLAADLVAALFDNPQVAPVLRWMTLALVFQALGAVSLGLLKRNLDFRSVQIAHVTSYFVGFLLVGVGAAWLGWGEWSLVAAWVVQAFVASAIQYARAPHPVAPTLRPGQARLAGFGFRTVVASLANWTIENVDNFMVGRAYSTTTLGAYSVAYSLVRTPVNHIVFALQQVIQPFTARSREDRETMRKAYFTLLWAVGLVTMPAFFGAAALAPTLIDALYGSAWVEAVALLVPLAAAMPLHSVQAVGGPVLWGSERVGREIMVSMTVALALLAALAVASRISVVAMAWTVWFAYLVRAVWVTTIVSGLVGTSPLRSLSMLRGGLLVGTATAALLFAADAAMAQVGLTAVARLCASIALGAALLPLLALLLAKVIVPRDIGAPIGHLLKRFPEPVRGYLERRVGGLAVAGER